MAGRRWLIVHDGARIDELSNGTWTMRICAHGQATDAAAPFRGIRVAP